jgi:hypothetical protein
MKPKIITRDDVKQEVDNLPENALERLYNFIASIRRNTYTKSRGTTLRSFHLKGQFDDVNIRQRALE